MKNCLYNTAYIAAVNPAVILELIADYERLQKENEELRANNYGPEILNDPQSLTVCYFAGRMAEGREKNRDMDKILEEKRQLEKEAEWLASRLKEFCDPEKDDQCCVLCRKNCDGVKSSEWRKAAREAMKRESKP